MPVLTQPESTRSHSNDLTTRVRLSLNKLSYHQLDGVHCQVSGGHVKLTGHLRSYYLKQIAQAIAMRVPGVMNVENEISVRNS